MGQDRQGSRVAATNEENTAQMRLAQPVEAMHYKKIDNEFFPDE
jgi:hypothetical protein